MLLKLIIKSVGAFLAKQKLPRFKRSYAVSLQGTLGVALKITPGIRSPILEVLNEIAEELVDNFNVKAPAVEKLN